MWSGNSEWGWGGIAWIAYGDLDRLLHEEGEAALPTVRAVPADSAAPCNKALGLVRDDPTVLRKLADYIDAAIPVRLQGVA